MPRGTAVELLLNVSVRLLEVKVQDVPGVADGDGGAQQRTGHGVRAGESDGTGLLILAIMFIATCVTK